MNKYIQKIKIGFKKYYISKFNDTIWMKEITKCQDEILTLDPHPHYVSEYRESEISYWFYIAKWIYENREKKHTKCLDIGCAYGTLALFCKKLFNSEIYCIDFVDTYLSQKLANKYNFNFKVSNIELDEFPWNVKFDLIIFTETLEHLNFHPAPTLIKIRELLAEEGVLYISTPDASQWGRITKYYSKLAAIPSPQQRMPIVDDHIYQYMKQELFKVVTEAGFKIRRFNYSPGLLNRHFNMAVVIK